MTKQKTNKKESGNLIRFDWAIKRLLRNKADHIVLNGFLSELLREDIRITKIIDPEGNQASATDKFNRVDILAENHKGELMIIELQNSSEADYFLRMVYGVSRAIIDHINLGEPYKKVRKVYSVHIAYFDLGQGEDYVYHGKSDFLGIHKKDTLELSKKQQKYFGVQEVSSVFPEYYIIRINGFNNVAKDTLDQWIYYLKNDKILDDFKAKGLAEVRRTLQIDSLSETDKKEYLRHIDNVVFEEKVVSSAIREGQIDGEEKGLKKGRAEGLKEGLKKGKAEGKIEGKIEGKVEMALSLIADGCADDFIRKHTQLTIAQIQQLRKDGSLSSGHKSGVKSSTKKTTTKSKKPPSKGKI